MTNAVKFSVSIGVGGCWWPRSLSVVHSGIVVFPLLNSTPSSASADDSTTCRTTRHLVCSGPLFIGCLGCLEGSADIELKKRPPTLLRDFGSLRYEASLCTCSTMSLALYLTISLVYVAEQSMNQVMSSCVRSVCLYCCSMMVLIVVSLVKYIDR